MKKEYDFSKGKVVKGPVVDPKKAKVQTTVRIDGDILVWLQKRSAEEGIAYQTLMNKVLREAMKRPSLEERVSALEKKIKGA